MRRDWYEYLKDRHHIWELILGFFVVVVLGIALFTPYRIHSWVESYKEWLLWTGVSLLILQIGVFLHEISLLRSGMAQLLSPEKNEVVDVPEMYNFYDERGELKLSLKADALYYLEAADNYVKIHYAQAGKIHGLLIRNTLKNVEWRFRGKDLIRCHRSYIVNFGKVQMLRKEEGDVMLDFGDERLPNIPVSKSYQAVVIERFASTN